jgi:hypothetical protein
MKDLTDRIAAAIYRSSYCSDNFSFHDLTDTARQPYRDLAQAVLSELGLRIERGQRSKPTGTLWASNNRYTVTRWVTDWKADDE